ncbi:MAG: zinc-binding dehydrogenase [Acidimicrobiia bacterium]|nr:zinc-binding dehydrogenase [Acidimicrobiia bacterium]
MKALVLHEFDGPLVLEEVPVPVLGSDDVLLRVRACAVDQFDLTIRAGKRANATVPLVLGHEIAGEVAALGASVEGWRVGDRVVSTLYLTCGNCRKCLSGRETICEDFRGYIGIETPGGYAEYTTVPAVNLVSLPDTIGFAQGSVLANAVGTPYHAFAKRMRLGPAEHVIITGAGGGVGIHAIQVARAMGAFVMAVDLGQQKLEAALRYGAHLAVDPGEREFSEIALEWTGGLGVDGVLELVGPATMPQSLKALAKGGRMVIVGSHTGREFPLDTLTIYANEWEILGSRNVSKSELRDVVALTADGRVSPVVATGYGLEDAEELHRQVAAREVIGRAVIEP